MRIILAAVLGALLALCAAVHFGWARVEATDEGKVQMRTYRHKLADVV